MDSAASSSSPASNVTINDLPCEMLLKVFSYLDQDQLLNTIPEVCKRWETLHSDPTLYRSFTFTQKGPSTDEVIQLLRIAKWLKILNLYNRTDINAILDCVKISNQRLETLHLWNCKGSPFSEAISSDSMLGVMDQCNLLQHLSLYGSYCQGTEVYNEIGLRLPSLRSVDLGQPTSFDPQALVNIADNCRELGELRAIQGGELKITDHLVSYICSRAKYLKIIEINFYESTDVSMFTLATCHQLHTLEMLYAFKITDIGIMAISDMPQLVKLTVQKNHQISTQGWLAFLQRPIMRRLQELDLYRCVNVNQKAVNIILDNLYNLRELRIKNDELNFTRFFNPGNN